MSTLKEKLSDIQEFRMTQVLLKSYSKQVISFVWSSPNLKVLNLYFYNSCDAIQALSKFQKWRNFEEVIILYTDGRLFSIRNFEVMKKRWLGIVNEFISKNKNISYFEFGPIDNIKETYIKHFKLKSKIVIFIW